MASSSNASDLKCAYYEAVNEFLKTLEKLILWYSKASELIVVFWSKGVYFPPNLSDALKSLSESWCAGAERRKSVLSVLNYCLKNPVLSMGELGIDQEKIRKLLDERLDLVKIFLDSIETLKVLNSQIISTELLVIRNEFDASDLELQELLKKARADYRKSRSIYVATKKNRTLLRTDFLTKQTKVLFLRSLALEPIDQKRYPREPWRKTAYWARRLLFGQIKVPCGFPSNLIRLSSEGVYLPIKAGQYVLVERIESSKTCTCWCEVIRMPSRNKRLGKRSKKRRVYAVRDLSYKEEFEILEESIIDTSAVFPIDYQRGQYNKSSSDDEYGEYVENLVGLEISNAIFGLSPSDMIKKLVEIANGDGDLVVGEACLEMARVLVVKYPNLIIDISTSDTESAVNKIKELFQSVQ